eukprot:TRINITY_DN4732_c0_g1_i1.p1 TRINITY_DN4732_c0_g1~~TRINITY_DN4732_c0_g1_i1.p1  ORF type:complete len:484 (+),score=117.65 TRINITY_DN4732_c0_g1_i1:3-1454(+)
MKQTAEQKLGQRVRKAVITVPAYFSDSQRQATKDAGNIAGLEVLRIINEPTAAALAFGLGRAADRPCTILVFDLGGGTFDVSLLRIEEGVFEVKATAGDTHLGGEDFDARVTEYLIEDFRRKFRCDKDITTNPRALRKLRSAAERAKRSLSSSTQTQVEIEGLHEGHDFNSNLTRARFEDLNADLFEEVLIPVEQVLQDARIDKSSVDEVVMVGGSTRIPKVKEIVQQFFGNKELNHSVNADEAVAYGAAIQASILSDLPSQESDATENVVLLDVTPLSLGIRTQGDVMSTLIARNSTIPTKAARVYSTDRDNQTTVNIQVYEGERRFTSANKLLGNFKLTGIPPRPKGTPKINVEFELDADGILVVSAVDEETLREKKITIQHDRSRLTEQEIGAMIAEAKLFEEEEKQNQERIQERNKLEDKCLRVRKKIKSIKNPQPDMPELLNAVADIEKWLDANPNAKKAEFVSKAELLSQISLALEG